jgi:hypothetical protein
MLQCPSPAPLYVEQSTFGGRKYPYVPLSCSEIAILRGLVKAHPNRYPHGAHHLGQLCDRRKDGRYCLRALERIPGVPAVELAAFSRRLRTLCGDGASAEDRMSGLLHQDLERHMDWQDHDPSGVPEPLSLSAFLGDDLDRWCGVSPPEGPPLSVQERLIWSRLERSAKPCLAVSVPFTDDNELCTVKISKERRQFMEHWLPRHGGDFKSWSADYCERLCHSSELHHVRPEFERILVSHWGYKRQLCATPFTAWRRESGLSHVRWDSESAGAAQPVHGEAEFCFLPSVQQVLWLSKMSRLPWGSSMRRRCAGHPVPGEISCSRISRRKRNYVTAIDKLSQPPERWHEFYFAVLAQLGCDMIFILPARPGAEIIFSP